VLAMLFTQAMSKKGGKPNIKSWEQYGM